MTDEQSADETMDVAACAAGFYPSDSRIAQLAGFTSTSNKRPVLALSNQSIQPVRGRVLCAGVRPVGGAAESAWLCAFCGGRLAADAVYSCGGRSETWVLRGERSRFAWVIDLCVKSGEPLLEEASFCVGVDEFERALVGDAGLVGAVEPAEEFGLGGV